MASGLNLSSTYPETYETLINILFGNIPDYEWPVEVLSRKSSSQGVLTGGNLAIICTLLGTASEVDTKGKMLFFEETGENLYRIDRMIMQLKRAGKLEHITGLIIGDFSGIPDAKEAFGKNAHEIIAEAVREYNYPVAFGFPGGHLEDNRALILGRTVSLTVAENNKLVFDQK